ncbi:hypothetical protein Tco_1030231 [Tanacetum coccineum]|uniref:Uncharacterized protein n=1 Tax=Tanacetum coccineum TaxID=301880 RepID=A0ABQ5G622_9ASTR
MVGSLLDVSVGSSVPLDFVLWTMRELPPSMTISVPGETRPLLLSVTIQLQHHLSIGLLLLLRRISGCLVSHLKIDYLSYFGLAATCGCGCSLDHLPRVLVGEERQLKACSLLHQAQILDQIMLELEVNRIPKVIGGRRVNIGSLLQPDIWANKSCLTDFHYEGEMCGAFVGQKRKRAESQRRRGRRRVTHCEIPSPSTDLTPHNLLLDRNTLAGLGLARVFTLPVKKYTHEAGQSKETLSKVHYVALSLFLEVDVGQVPMAVSEPPSSSCRRSVQQNQPVTQPYPASDSRDIVCLYYMLRVESVSRANNANVLWCYKNKLELSRAASDVEKNSSDCGKRKLTTYKDFDIFETYSQLSARNVRPRFSSDLPQASGVNTSQPMYNEAVSSMFVHTIRF